MGQALVAATDIFENVMAKAIGQVLFGSKEAEDDDIRPPDAPESKSFAKNEAKPLVFPTETPLVVFNEGTARLNDFEIKRMRKLLKTYGPPSYEDMSDDSWEGINWSDMINIWTPYRRELLRHKGRLYQALASLSTMWGYFMANPDAGLTTLVKVYLQGNLKYDDISEEGFNRLRDHVLDFVEGAAV